MVFPPRNMLGAADSTTDALALRQAVRWNDMHRTEQRTTRRPAGTQLVNPRLVKPNRSPRYAAKLILDRLVGHAVRGCFARAVEELERERRTNGPLPLPWTFVCLRSDESRVRVSRFAIGQRIAQLGSSDSISMTPGSACLLVPWNCQPDRRTALTEGHRLGTEEGIMADTASGLTSVGSKNGTVRNGDALARALSEERAFSESNQALADVDQALSEADQTAADVDQAAADMDQAAADVERAAGTEDALAIDLRSRAAQQRRRAAVLRADVAAARDSTGDTRDGTATERDQAAAERDQVLAALER